MPIDTTRQRQIDCLRMRLLEFAAFELEAARKQFKVRISSHHFAKALYEELLTIHLNDTLRRMEADIETDEGQYAD